MNEDKKLEEVEKETDIAVQSPRFETIPKVPISPHTANEKERSVLNDSILELTQELTNLEDLKIQLEQSINEGERRDELRRQQDLKFQNDITVLFNNVNKNFHTFSEKMDKEVNYTRELEKGATIHELELQLNVTTQAFNNQKAQLTTFIDETKSSINETIHTIINTVNNLSSDMTNKCLELKNADEQIAESLSAFREELTSDETNEIKKHFSDITNEIKKQFNNEIANFTQVMNSSSDNQAETVRIKQKEALEIFTENARETLETVRKESINFLRQCQEENKKILKSIPKPENGAGLTRKDIIILVLAALSVVSMLAKWF